MPEKKPHMVASYMGPGWAKIEKPDPTKGQTIGKTPWPELIQHAPHLFDTAGKYQGPGKFDPSTYKYFDFAFKGQSDCKIDRSAYTVSAKMLDDIANNAPELKVLDTENRWLIDTEMCKMFEALETNSTIVELKLAHNDCDEAASELAEVLKTNKTITKVDISSNDIHTKGITALGEMLKVNTTLKELNMANNFCREEVADIAAGIAANKTLTKLNLNVSQINDEGAKALKEGLDKNTTLKELTGYNNPVLDKDLRKWLKAPRMP
jgi:Ran GTPase-activating protein (RanGAP) involved in mRNA processing and transport